MLSQLEYLSKKIKNLFQSIRHEHFQIIMAEQEDGQFDEEHSGYTKFWIKERIKEAYYLVLTFLELKGLPTMAARFEAEFLTSLSDNVKLFDTTQSHPDSYEENKMLNEFDIYLMAFKEFQIDFQDQLLKETQLLSVLGNTGHILSKLKPVISNEADIYKSMQWFLSQFYPSTRFTQKAGFIRRFKTYRPDILIPELKTAIEYKYINNFDDNVDKFLDELKVDSTNFTGDPDYENFIAVIFFEHVGTATPESIFVAWKEKSMPTNWKLILTGFNTKNSKVL